MFAYCENNPVNRADPTGHSWKSFWNSVTTTVTTAVKTVVKAYAKYVAKPTVSAAKKVSEKVISGTTTKSVTFSGAAGVAVTGSLGYAYDGNGNIAILGSGGGGGGMPSVSLTASVAKTNAPSVDHLRDWSVQAGGSVSLGPVSAGVEGTFFTSSIDDNPYGGCVFSAGIGAKAVPFEMHGEAVYTKVIYQINVFEEFDRIYDAVMAW